MSLESSDLIYDNINGENKLSNDEIMYHISSVGRALKSFFPQEGIFNQLISSDLIKRIRSETLKNRLFKLYNEDLRRHDVHTKEYDNFFLEFNYKLSEKFFLEHNWKTDASDENQITILSVFIGLGGCLLFMLGSKDKIIIGALLINVWAVLDCVDGNIARLTKTEN